MAARSLAPPGHAVRKPGGKLLHLAGRLAQPRGPGQILGRLGLVQQHLKIGADHPVAVFDRGPFIAAGGRVLRNLPEDPRVRRRGAADHHRVAAGLRHHGRRVFRSANVAVADDRNLHRLLDLWRSTPSAPGRCSPARGCGRAAPRRSAPRPRPSAPVPRRQSAARSSPCGISR